MRNPQYIKTPFAATGDRSEIPAQIQVNGAVSMEEGWPAPYSANRLTDPNARNVERTVMNQLFYLITSNLQIWQEQGFPDWVTAAQNGGTPATYPLGAVVMHGTPPRPYISKVGNNTQTPSNGAGVPNANWADFAGGIINALRKTGGTATGPIALNGGGTTTRPPDGNNSSLLATTSWLRDGQISGNTATAGYFRFAKNLGGLQMNYGYTTFDAIGQNRIITLPMPVQVAQLGVSVTEYSEVAQNTGVLHPLVFSGRYLSNTQINIQLHNSTVSQPSAGVFWQAWSI